MNAVSYIVLAVVICAVAAALRSVLKNRGKGDCGSSCANCSLKDTCGKK